MASKDSNHRDFDTSFDFEKLFEGVIFDEKIKDKTSFNSSVFSYLKDALISFIEHNTKHHLIIGLTGKWGSGKTSFCKYLEHSLNKESNSNDRKSSEEADSKNNDNLSSFEESNKEINRNPSNSTQIENKREYVFFFYDLWTHQHETFRKSILSELSSYLLDKKVLKNKCSIHPNESLFEWMKKTNVGSIYNHEKSIIYPVLSFFLIGSVIWWFIKNDISINCFLRKINGYLDQFFNINCVENYCNLLNQEFVPCGSLLLLLVLVVIAYSAISRFKTVLVAFLSRVYSLLLGKSTFKSILSTKNNDLSFSDMRFWVKTLISNIHENTTIIVVLDNLDRLDGRIVKDLFATVHELFSELNKTNGHNKDFNLTSDLYNQAKNLHLIIPFDYSYLLEIYPSSVHSQHSICNVVASLNSGFSSIHPDHRSNGAESERTNGDNSSEPQESKTKSLYGEFQDESSKNLSIFNIQSTLLNDYLDKTFSAIFYLPHVNPFNFYKIFEENLRNILVKWCENLRFYNHDHGLFFNYIEKQGENFTVETINRDEFCNAINEFENKELNEIIKLCWQIFRFNIEKKDLDSNTNSYNNNNLTPSKTADSPLFNEINIRRILSFIRDFAVILQINSRIFFVDKTLGIKKIPLYVALYCRYIAYFRSLGFAAVLNIIGDQWRIKRLGIFEDISKRTIFTQSENEDYQFFVLYTNLEIIYYQTSFEKLTDELYLETLLDAFKLNSYVILLHKLNTSYFAQNTREVLALLFDNEEVDSGKIIKFFEKVLSDDFLFRRDIEKKLKVWNDIYCQVLIHYSENILFGNKTRADLFNDRHFYKRVYILLDKILDIKINNNSTNYKKFLELMISFLRIIVYQFTYFYDSESIRFFIYCVENYIKKNQAYYALKNLDNSSVDVESILINNKSIALPVYVKNTVLFDADKKQCYIYVDGGNVAKLVNKLKDKHDLFEDINQLPLVFFIKYNHRNTPDLTLLYSYPISKKMRLFYINHFDFSFENQQSLIMIFSELFNSFIDNIEIKDKLLQLNKKSFLSIEDRKGKSIDVLDFILRILYIYVLLAHKVVMDHNNFICKDFFEKLEDVFSNTLEKLDLVSYYEKIKSTSHFSVEFYELPPFVRFVLLIIVKFDLGDNRIFIPPLEKSCALEKQEVISPDLDSFVTYDNDKIDSLNDVIPKGAQIQNTITTTENTESHLSDSQNDYSKKIDKLERLISNEEQEVGFIINCINIIFNGVESRNVSVLDLNCLYSYVKNKDVLFYLRYLTSWKTNLKGLKK